MRSRTQKSAGNGLAISIRNDDLDRPRVRGRVTSQPESLTL